MILLEDRSILEFKGEDRLSFLQGLVTCDVTTNAPLIYGVMLSPQGKIRFDFFVHRMGDQCLMDVPTFHLEDIKKIFRLYKLRAKVTIEENPELAVVAALQNLHDFPADPRLSAMGYRSIVPREGLVGQSLLPNLSYHTHRINCGIPDSVDFIADRAFVSEYGLEHLNAISFTKGCYVGQEVVARTKHRGTVHKTLHKVVSASGHLPEIDSAIMTGDKEIGILRSSIEGQGLAIIRKDKLAKAEGAIMVKDVILDSATMPEWFNNQ